ncbi:MAG: hypothetical protein WBV94_04895 [Blastocatellia bacterium]
MSKQADNDPSPDNTPNVKNGSSNAYDKGARQLAYISIFISIMVFLFGDDVLGRAVERINVHWPWFIRHKINGLEGGIAILNVLLAAFVLWDPKTRQAIKYADNASTPPSTKNSFRKLMLGWRLLWLVRMLLYSWLGANCFGLHNYIEPQWTWYIADVLHLLVGFFYYFLFFVLDPPSVTTESTPDSAIVFRRSVITVLVFGCIVFIASVLVSWYHSPPPEGGITDIFVHKLIPTYTGIGMAFFIGRLDSHYLRIPRVILAPLYLYVIVQPLWGRVEGTDISIVKPERAAILVLVLILKFVFFYSIARWIRKGSFLHYLIKIEGDRNK